MAGRRKKYCIQLGEKNQQLKLGEENRVAFRREHIMVVGKKQLLQFKGYFLAKGFQCKKKIIITFGPTNKSIHPIHHWSQQHTHENFG